MPERQKTFREAMLCWKTAKWVASAMLTAAVLAAGVLVTYYKAEGAQDREIDAHAKRAVRIETELDAHIRSADKTFRRFNETMREQQVLIHDTRETMSGINASLEAGQQTQGRILEAIQDLGDSR